jgi:broad specificity phosphatase PhoE
MSARGEQHARDGGDAHGARAQDPQDQVVLVRHAETQWSLEGRHTGRTDIPLTDRGREAALRLPARMASWRFELVLVSPASRARETCDLAGLGEQAQVSADLLEWDYGEYEGLTSAQIQRLRPGWSLWRDGCPGGERAADVGARADRVIGMLQRAPGPAAVFSHGHMLRVLGARWIALEARNGGHLGLDTAAICVLGHERGLTILARWNDTHGAHGTPASG